MSSTGMALIGLAALEDALNRSDALLNDYRGEDRNRADALVSMRDVEKFGIIRDVFWPKMRDSPHLSKCENFRRQWLMRIIMNRMLVLVLAILPVMLTHGVTGELIALWPVGFMISLLIWSRIDNKIRHYLRGVGVHVRNVALAVAMGALVTVVTLTCHSCIQYAVLIYHGEPWVDMFATEFNARLLSAYIEDRVLTTQHVLHWFHIFG